MYVYPSLSVQWNQHFVSPASDVESEPFDSELELLQHRAWVLHWSLYVYFNSKNNRDEVIEMFLNTQPYLNTIMVLSATLCV